jgi:hypothetical protein
MYINAKMIHVETVSQIRGIMGEDEGEQCRG